MCMDAIIDELFLELSEEIKSTGDNDLLPSVLRSKIKNAYREVKKARNYPVAYTDEAIGRDMENYMSNIKELALYDYNQIGAEGETQHEENGTSRTWKDRKECLNGVYPFATIL
mgnify:CR=1 FL=1